jgi:hypothetical protein
MGIGVPPSLTGSVMAWKAKALGKLKGVLRSDITFPHPRPAIRPGVCKAWALVEVSG